MAPRQLLMFTLLTAIGAAPLGEPQQCSAGGCQPGSSESFAAADDVDDFAALGLRLQRHQGPHAGEADPLALSELNKTTGWSCKWPLKPTGCVWSAWHWWKNDKDKFREKCNGQLHNFDGGNVEDCGTACISCSWIRACCDDCSHIKKVTGYWSSWGCTDHDFQYTLEVGLKVETSNTWSRTESWSQSVSTEASREANVGLSFEGVGEAGVSSSMKLSSSSSYAFSRTFSHSWTKTASSSEKRVWTQAAGTCGWVWEVAIESTCGMRTATTRNYQSTDRGNPPCCMPMMNATANPYGDCLAGSDGKVVNLCKKP